MQNIEIVNTKQIKKIVWTISIITILFTIIPIQIYHSKFNGNLSDSATEWGVFGDYFGGIVGTLFNLLAVIFSLISIYITLKIASRIHENEQKFNQENIEREHERFNKEIELVHKQNKPYPHIDCNRYKNKIEIILTNQGPGTLIITDWKLIYNEVDYEDFGHLISLNILNVTFDKIIMLYEKTGRQIINSGGRKTLFAIEETIENLISFPNFYKDCRKTISNTTIRFYYEDIFENKYEYEESLKV